MKYQEGDITALFEIFINLINEDKDFSLKFWLLFSSESPLYFMHHPNFNYKFYNLKNNELKTKKLSKNENLECKQICLILKVGQNLEK